METNVRHVIDAEVVKTFRRKKLDDILSRTEIAFPNMSLSRNINNQTQ
jgi:hypothetical protein